MQIHHVGYRNRGFYRVAALGQLWDMTPKDAQRRFEILRFFNKHGLAATRDAFGVSRRTLYRWKAALKAQGGNPAALAAQSCAPRKRRVPKTDPRLVSEIRRLRTLHPNLGKAKLHVLLGPWCARHGIALPSVSTIGRIKSARPRQDAPRPRPHRQPRAGQAPAATQQAQKTQAGQSPSPGGAGLRHHRAHPRRHAPLYRQLHRSGLTLCLCRGATLQARPIHRPRPRTGPVPAAPAPHDGAVRQRQRVRSRLRPAPQGARHPALVHLPQDAQDELPDARFHRTIQESFVDDHDDLLFTDLALFNRKLADWLVFYNA